jgi:hypothetical protein
MIIRTLAIIICAIGLWGCTSVDRAVHPLTYHQAVELVTVVNEWATQGGAVPEEVRRLDPIQVYGDHGNVVIALNRDAHGENGYYIVPSSSSFDPRYRPNTGADAGWTLTPMKNFNPDLTPIYKYSRTF